MNIRYWLVYSIKQMIGKHQFKTPTNTLDGSSSTFTTKKYDKEKTNNQLNDVGPGMCLAKWKQVTLHLGLGHTHSCHHPRTHKIPISEIAKSPSALHNTSIKKIARKQMLEGDRPSECQYCWNVEDSAPKDTIVYSDRTLKSAEPWALPFFDEVMSAGSEQNINPSYLEVSFSNVCNFKCSYCSPDVSSKWMEEIKQHGPYPTSINYNTLEWVKHQNKMPIPEREDNPYIDAFWDWWPELYPTLHTFRITGGEPLMSKHTFKLLEYVLEHPNPNLELGINSNFCVEDKLMDRFIELIKKIKEQNVVKEIIVYTSCEAQGPQAEYIRFGLNYNKWLDSCDKFLSAIPNPKLTIMSTYNLLSVPSYQLFLEDILNLNIKFGKISNMHPVNIDIPYLNNPPHQVVGLLTPDFIEKIKDQIAFMNSHHANVSPNYIGFHSSEIQKLERLLAVFEPKILGNDPTKTRWRKDFAIFVDEHDRRRGTDFLKTFPELTKFYNLCKQSPGKQ